MLTFLDILLLSSGEGFEIKEIIDIEEILKPGITTREEDAKIHATITEKELTPITDQTMVNTWV